MIKIKTSKFMKNKFKILTLITVVKNDKKNIRKTIKSIITKKSKFIEYIVIDGKSTDGTAQIVKEYRNNINKIISEKDNGIYDAMNKGIRKARGEYVGFCNSGDFFHKNGIKTIIDKLRVKKLDVLFATIKRNYMGASVIKSGFNLKRLKYNFDFATSHSTGFFYKRKIHNKIGYYSKDFKCSADYDFYIRLFKIKNLKIGKTNKNNIIGEVKEGGFSSKLTFLEHLNEETKIRLKNKQSLVLILLIYINSIIKNFKKVLIQLYN